MLCVPVMYDADALKVCAPIQSALQVPCPRYDRLAMPPLVGHDAVHCSVTCWGTWFSGRSLPGRSRVFQLDRYVPRPASSSSLLVSVDVYFTCCTRCHP